MKRKMKQVIDLDEEYLERLGNIDQMRDQYDKTYQYIRRSAEFIGVLDSEKIALKVYHMHRENQKLPEHLVSGLESFLESEIESGNIDPKQGAGFAILSQGFLSVNVWGRGNVLFTQTYTVEKDPETLSSEPLEKTGVACTWEQRIMFHEYEAWHRYLESDMGNKAKRDYLGLHICGKLWEEK